MKNKQIIIMLLAIFLFFTSCEPKPKPKEKTIKKELELPKHLINRIDVHELEVLEIDNCEYIFYKKSPNRNMGFGFMAHKGNCKNPIHYYGRTEKQKL
ncbi:MAG: hypothetical protein L3J23_08035 [Flavobacteriaceae bacterium]|nr:hypothetical protein [Flavobacteriaceae bacterium]